MNFTTPDFFRFQFTWTTFFHPCTFSLYVSLDLKWVSSSVQFSSVTVVSDSLWPHESQHTRPPCPSLTPGVHPNPCPLSRWCHPTISPSVIPFSCPQSFQHQGLFQWVTLHTRWPKYWSFSFSSNEHPGLFSFRLDWLDLFAVQGTLKSLLQHHSSKASILQPLVDSICTGLGFVSVQPVYDFWLECLICLYSK